MQPPSPAEVLMITIRHGPLPLPIGRKCTDVASLCRTTIAPARTAHAAQETNIFTGQDVQVVRLNVSDASHALGSIRLAQGAVKHVAKNLLLHLFLI